MEAGSLCRAVYAFAGDGHPSGLRFDAGDTIRVLQALADGWCEGERGDDKGWFPAAYVRLVEMSAPGSPQGGGEERCSTPLPQGWQCYISPQGQKYYVNTFTHETTWERPTGEASNRSVSTPSTPSPTGEPALLFAGEASLSPTPSQKNMRKSSSDIQGSQLESPSKKSTTTLTINGVTFPHPDALCEQTLLKPGEWSYCDYFWSDRKDAQGNAGPSGFEVIVSKQLKGRQMSKEMAEFVRDRIRIEEEYAKNLSKMSQSPLALQEEGTLGEAWSQLKKSLSDEAEVHLKFAAKLHTEVEKPLLSYRENLKKELKKFEHHISEHRKQLLGRLANVDKAKKVLAERQRDLEVKSQQLEIKPTNKTEEDIKKARRKSTQAGDDLMKCVDLYNQTQSKWFEEVVTTSLELERMESSRIEMVQEHLCRYAQLRHETDMFNQSTMEPVDQSLQKVDPTKDRELWIKDHKTGHVQPINMEV
ncbi:growth arrest-specific protein 7-like isoform X1 [Lampetra fluviatilis]